MVTRKGYTLVRREWESREQISSADANKTEAQIDAIVKDLQERRAKHWGQVAMDLAKQVLGKRPNELASVFGQSALVAPPPGLPGAARRYLKLADQGISMVLDDNVAIGLQLWSGDREPEEYAEYTGPLPGNVKFSSSRQEVRQALGTPRRSDDGGAGRALLGSMMYPWDSFHIDGYKVNFEYNEQKTGIRLVSITKA